jgi:uncharacterized protein (DUF849 family)
MIEDNGVHKLIINFTPTGMIPTREMTPHVPLSPQEIIKDVLEARQFGVSMVHLHARDQDGQPSCKKKYMQRLLTAFARLIEI